MPKITINHRELEVPEGMTVMQAAELAGVEIPVFCYHSRLSIAGNCRMCLVEVEKSPKPVASCAMPVAEGMVVHTDSPLVKKARKGVLELLLINHPLDCPICDQGGECDLQDITMAYGPSTSRFDLNKRAVKDKNLGPLIKTAMNRCIHCTRCVRFATEVAGVPELGATGRGEKMEIGTYVEKALTSELSGNMIDLCPVGALTAKPSAFKGRSWEYEKTESIDVLDAVGSNIRVDTYKGSVVRILPRLNEEINEEWISDKTRFACDGLRYQRLDTPYLRGEDGRLRPASWEEALERVSHILKATKPAGIVGDLADAESMMALKDLLGSAPLECRQEGALFPTHFRQGYLFNTTLAGIEEADLCLLIGANPRREATLVNARLRKSFVYHGLKVASLSAPADLTYPVEHLGTTPDILEALLSGDHPFCRSLKKAKRPMLILGSQALCREDGEAIWGKAWQLAQTYGVIREDWNGFNMLHRAASRVGGVELGLTVSGGVREILRGVQKGDITSLYLLGADEVIFEKPAGCFVIYQGHHGDRGAQNADVVLPGLAYTEKDGLYWNMEGRCQQTWKACSPLGQAKEDWKILRILGERMGVSMPYQTLDEVRHRVRSAVEAKKEGQVSWREGSLRDVPFEETVKDYYGTDVISRHSPTLQKCREVVK